MADQNANILTDAQKFIADWTADAQKTKVFKTVQEYAQGAGNYAKETIDYVAQNETVKQITANASTMADNAKGAFTKVAGDLSALGTQAGNYLSGLTTPKDDKAAAKDGAKTSPVGNNEEPEEEGIMAMLGKNKFGLMAAAVGMMLASGGGLFGMIALPLLLFGIGSYLEGGSVKQKVDEYTTSPTPPAATPAPASTTQPAAAPTPAPAAAPKAEAKPKEAPYVPPVDAKGDPLIPPSVPVPVPVDAPEQPKAAPSESEIRQRQEQFDRIKNQVAGALSASSEMAQSVFNSFSNNNANSAPGVTPKGDTAKKSPTPAG